jgi:hypothetical protein
MTDATLRPISRYPVPALDAIPEDIRARILKVQEKSGFIPNVFLMLAYWPDEFRAFMAYHDALMDKEGGRAGSVCLDRFSGLIGGVSAGFRPPRSAAAE